ncbi:MAG: hypothetical protein HZB42_06130 [Sphingobacteriales bacterium]|nr:hypothetical protein [Sphingobacteriales bacterium]
MRKCFKNHFNAFIITVIISFASNLTYSQKQIADSLIIELKTEKTDTGKVILMWNLARAIYTYNPDSALLCAQQALFLAKDIKYAEGQSRSLGILANTFNTIGNYPRALELNLEKLKLEEKRKIPYNLASVLMNTGIVYVYLEDYANALDYYRKADSVIRKHDVEKFKYNIALNFGDVYDRQNILDSAYLYYDRSLNIAKQKLDTSSIGISLTGLGHCNRKYGHYNEAIASYVQAIGYLKSKNNDETLCEAALGLASVYKQQGKNDSAAYYARLSLFIAKTDGLLPKELDAAEFLTEHYKQQRKVDSAFTYVSQVKDLNDSLNSKSKIRETQIISTGEQFRQRELEQERKAAEKERFQQLQMLLIGIFIPGFFLLTFLLTRVRIHVQVIRLLGILSLLFLFEYLTLLLHPTVANLTNHVPVFEILIFVGLAAILIPAHHKLEQWMIHRLIHRHAHHEALKKEKALRENTEKNNPPENKSQ